MSENKNQLPEDALEQLFESEKAGRIAPDANLVERILTDAALVSAGKSADWTVDREPGGWVCRITRLLIPVGGMPGLVTAGICAGVGLWAGTAGLDTLYSVPGMGDYLQSTIEGYDYDIMTDTAQLFTIVEEG